MIATVIIILGIYTLNKAATVAPKVSENFSAVIKDTFKRTDLPSRFEREFHIDANGQIRTGVKAGR